MLTTAAAAGSATEESKERQLRSSWTSSISIGHQRHAVSAAQKGKWGDPQLSCSSSHRGIPRTSSQQRPGPRCSFEGLSLSGTETSWIPSGWTASRNASHETSSPWRPTTGSRREGATVERQQSMPALRHSPSSLSAHNKSRRLGPIGEEGTWRESSPPSSSFRGNRPIRGAASSSALAASYASSHTEASSSASANPPGLSLRPKRASWNLRESPDATVNSAGAQHSSKQDPIGLFLLNIPSWTRVPEILNLLAPFGSIVNVGIESESEPIYAFVDFSPDEGRETAVSRALSELAGRMFFNMDSPLVLAPRFDRLSKPVFPVSPPEPLQAKEPPTTFDYQTLYIPALPSHVTKVQLLY